MICFLTTCVIGQQYENNLNNKRKENIQQKKKILHLYYMVLEHVYNLFMKITYSKIYENNKNKTFSNNNIIKCLKVLYNNLNNRYTLQIFHKC